MEDILKELYIDERKSIAYARKQIGVCDYTARKLMRGYGIKIRTVSEAKLPSDFVMPSKEQLRQWYVVENLSTRDISKKTGVSTPTINLLLCNNGIEIKSYSESKLPPGCAKPSKDLLKRVYTDEKMSYPEIGKKLGFGSSTIHRWLKENGVKIRSASEAKLRGVKKPSECQLRQLYLNEKVSAYKISKNLGLAVTTVYNLLREYDIPIRTVSEAKLPVNVRKPSEQQLRQWYVVEQKKAATIAKEVGVSFGTVIYWICKEGIQLNNNCNKELIKDLLKRYVGIKTYVGRIKNAS